MPYYAVWVQTTVADDDYTNKYCVLKTMNVTSSTDSASDFHGQITYVTDIFYSSIVTKE
jgi:hypothetical protein